MTRTTLTLAFLLALAGPALATPEEELTQLYKDTAASETPNMTFFNGLAAMGNFSVGPDVMEAVEEEARIPKEGLLGAFLSGIRSITKSGDRITFLRAKEVGIDVTGGFVRLPTTMKFRLRLKANEAKIDKISGARVGESAGSTYPLRSVRFERKAPLTYAHINAGYGLGLNKTKTVVAIDTTPPVGIAQAVSNN